MRPSDWTYGHGDEPGPDLEPEQPDPMAELELCSICNERFGVPIYGGLCLGCLEARRAEREEML